MSEVKLVKIPDIKKDLKISRIYMKRSDVRSMRRPMARSLPVWLAGATSPRPDHGDPLSALGAVYKRFGFKPPEPDPKQIEKLISFTKNWLRFSGLKPLENHEIPTVDEWLDGTTYTQDRRDELRKIWDDSSQTVDAKLMAIVKSFLKDETYPEPKYPRGINSRVDVAKCFFGPYVQAISDRMFDHPYFIKKVPVADRARHISDELACDDTVEGVEFQATDATSFEASFTKILMRIEYEMYKYFLGKTSAWPMLKKFLLEVKAGMNVCRFKFFTVYIEATRMSGEMDTSLANGFFNLMAFLFLAWQNGANVRSYRELPGKVEGDDGVFRLSHPKHAPTLEQYASIGVVIKIEKSKNLSELSFCGQVYDKLDQVVVADPIEVISRIGWTNKKYVCASNNTLLQLLRSKGFSLVYQYQGCPILDHLGRRLLEITDNVVVGQKILDGMDLWEREKLTAAMAAWKTRTAQLPVQPEIKSGTRDLVAKLYGISIDNQIAAEKAVSDIQLWQPFTLPMLEFPKEWEDFYERYSSPEYDDNPFWLNKDESKYIALLQSIPGSSAIIRAYLAT